MAVRTHTIVLSADASGTTSPLGSAEVVLVPDAAIGNSVWPHAGLAATHVAQGDHFEPSDPASDPRSGKWLLVVRAKDHSTVVQRLSFAQSGAIVRASGGWGKTGPMETAASVSIVNYGQVKGGPTPSGPESSLLTVTLFPAQNFVSLASPKTDATYQLFAKGRYSFLFFRGRLNAGAVGTLLNAPRKQTEVVVKAQPKDVDALVVVAVIPQADPAVEMSITDFYRELHRIGTDQPGSVVEAAVWSHAWHQGPIIFNRTDMLEQELDRFPSDTDGRPKDWHPSGVIAKQFSRLKDAFAKDGIFRIGGCSHMTNVVAEAKAALQQIALGTPRDRLYEVPMPEGWLVTSIDLSKRSIGQYIQAKTFVRYDEQGSSAGHSTYLGRAAQALPVPVFGAPPGCEGNMGTMNAAGRSLSTMKVMTVPYMNTETKTMTGYDNPILFEYFGKEFGGTFEIDELNYANYTKLLGEVVPGPVWSSRRSLNMKTDSKNRELRLATGLHFSRERASGNFERPVTYSEALKDGQLFVAKRARPESAGIKPYPDGASIRTVFLSRVEADGSPVTSDLGIFVRDDGHVLLRVREKGGAFAPWGGTIAVFDFDSTTQTWIDSGGVMASDEIQKANPEWKW